VYCCTSHRQAGWRFHHGATSAIVDRDTIASQKNVGIGVFAYADPPYPGLARRYYANRPDYGGEVDHAELVSRLTAGYDGWALSTSAAALRDVLAVSPAGVSVAVWVRGEQPTRSYLPVNAWEPVIFFGARRILSCSSARRLDVLQYVLRPRLTDTARVIGSKPAAFCSWLFALLGLQPADELVDVFPGSGRVAEAWQTFRTETSRIAELEGITAPLLL